jgi:hypothetical protein
VTNSAPSRKRRFSSLSRSFAVRNKSSFVVQEPRAWTFPIRVCGVSARNKTGASFVQARQDVVRPGVSRCSSGQHNTRPCSRFNVKPSPRHPWPWLTEPMTHAAVRNFMVNVHRTCCLSDQGYDVHEVNLHFPSCSIALSHPRN